MFNAASRLAITTAVVAVLVGFGTGIGISDRVGMTALVFAGVLAAVIGVASFYFTPRDPVVPVSAEVEAATSRSVDASDIPRTSAWPVVAAVAVTLLAVGAAIGKSLIVMGIILAVVAAFAWLGQVWTEHPSWTQAMTDRIHDRYVVPIGLPGTIVIFAGAGAISLSRLLLASSEKAAPFIAIALAAAVLAAFYLLATRDNVGRGVLTALVVVSTALIIGAGVAGALKGERKFEEESDAAKVVLVAKDLAFNATELQLPPDTKLSFELDNKDTVQHSFSIYEEEGGKVLAKGPLVDGGDIGSFELTSPDAGSYYFQCDVHPTQMNGTVVVSDQASKPSSATSTTTTSTTVAS